MPQPLADPLQRSYDPANISGILDDAESVDISTAFNTVRRRRGTIAMGTIVTTGVALIIAFLIPAKYTSTATFIPPSLNTGGSLASAMSGQLAALGATDLMGGMKTPGDLYAGILKSRSIATKLIHDFDLKNVYHVKKESDAEKELASFTEIVVDAKSTLVSISVTDKNPGRAQKLTDAYLNGLRETNDRLALTQSAQKARFFAQQLAQEKNSLADAEVELKITQEQSGLIAPTGQTEAEIRIIAQTQAEIAARQVQLAALRQAATEQNPDVIRLQSEIADLQRQLGNLEHGSTTGATIPTAKVPEIQLEYLRKQREVKYHEALFEILSRQYEAARLDQARESPVIQVLDPPSYPDTKSSPRRGLITFGGALLGLIGSCFWVLLRERSASKPMAAM